MFRSCIAIASAGMGHAQLERRGRPVRLLKKLPALPLDCEKSMDCVDFTHLVSFFLPKRLYNIEAAIFVSGPRKEFRKKGRGECDLESQHDVFLVSATTWSCFFS